jgi:hypothetical protein
MQQPPLLPEETLVRVTRLAKLDGTSVVILGSVFALMAAARGDAAFAIVGLLATAAGGLELHGSGQLRRGESGGMRWLLLSQPFLYCVVLGYCMLRLTHFEIPPIPERFQDTIELTAQQLGLSVEDYMRAVNRLSVQILAIASTIYQGLMTLYYVRRRRAVETALSQESFG